MAQAMITLLVMEPEKDLSEIISGVKGKPAEKSQPAQNTAVDFPIGQFSAPTSKQAGNGVSQKSSSSGKSSSSRLPGNSSATVNGRTAGASTGVTPSNVWQNPVPGSGAPSSPRRSPQKQLLQSLIPSPSSPMPGQDKAAARPLAGEQRRASSATPTTTTSSVTFGPVSTTMKASTAPAAGRAGSELRQQQGTPSSVAGGAGQKNTSRPTTGSVRVLQRQAPGTTRPDPQPLPIVSSHMPNSTSTSASSNTGMTSSGNFTTFHLWNNTSPTPILTKKEDFASVAAAGVVPNQPSQHSGQAAPGAPTPTSNDPTKAPGYKAGIRTASPHSRQDQASVSSSLPYPIPVGGPEHPDMHMLGFSGPMPSAPPHPGLPNPAGDGDHMAPHIPYPVPLEHPGGFPNQHANFPHLHQAMHPGLGPLTNQKEEYSTPHQPMTLPEIKSTLNPNAPDFQATASGSNGPGALINGYPPNMGNMRNGGDLANIPGGGGRGEAGGNNSGNAAGGGCMNVLQVHPAFLHLASQLGNINVDMGKIGNIPEIQSFFGACQQLLQQQQRSASPGPGGGNAGPGPGGPPHLVGHDGPGGAGGQGMGPSPGPGPGPGSHSPMSNYMAPQNLPRNVSPMPGQHRPNSAPTMPGMCHLQHVVVLCVCVKNMHPWVGFESLLNSWELFCGLVLLAVGSYELRLVCGNID